jgi:hypothetical protein
MPKARTLIVSVLVLLLRATKRSGRILGRGCHACRDVRHSPLLCLTASGPFQESNIREEDGNSEGAYCLEEPSSASSNGSIVTATEQAKTFISGATSLGACMEGTHQLPQPTKLPPPFCWKLCISPSCGDHRDFQISIVDITGASHRFSTLESDFL